jgi:hypothetical protein
MPHDPVIPPFEQAYILNKQLIDKASTLSDPVITVGGQAIQYWVSYYRELYRGALPDARLVTSVDVDYSARRHDVAAIAAALGVDPNMNEHGQPPSLARFALVDLETKQIKEVDGRFFADPDDPQRPNTVDVIDFPSGFSYTDFSGDKLLLNTERFMIEQDSATSAESHELIRVINPIACIRARLSNLSELKRNPEIEIARIKAMMLPAVYFLLEKFDAVTDPDDETERCAVRFREMKAYVDEFFRISMLEASIRVQVEHNISLHLILEQLAAIFEAEPESYYVPQAFWTKELPIKAAALKNNVDRIRRDRKRRADEQQQKELRSRLNSETHKQGRT